MKKDGFKLVECLKSIIDCDSLPALKSLKKKLDNKIKQIEERDKITYFQYCPNCGGNIKVHGENYKFRCDDCYKIWEIENLD